MPLAPTLELLRRARDIGAGIPAFNVIGIEHAEAIVCGAETAQAPVILQLSQNAVKYHHGRIEPIGRACAELASTASVPVALHLDHATSRELCERALACGFSSVMLDTADLPYEENVARTAELVQWAHGEGIAVEAGIGTVGGKDGAVTTADGMTQPHTARDFLDATGADSLAVAIGTTHSMTERTARIDLDLLGRIRAVVAAPLVLHGSSGVPDADLAAAVRHGITKVNLATQLSIVFTAAVRRHLAADPDVTDPRRYLAGARQAVAEVVADRIALLRGDAVNWKGGTDRIGPSSPPI